MKNSCATLSVAILMLGLVLGCGNKGANVSGTASFFNGPTPVGHRSIDHGSRESGIKGTRPQNGSWYLSPNKMIFTVTSIQLQGSNMDAVSVNCQFTYDLSQPGLTKLTDCPFTLPSGTYSSITIGLASTYQVLINDTTNNFYSTSSGIVTTAPGGGPQLLTVSTNRKSISSVFASSITIDSSSAPSVSVVVNGLQFFRVEVTGGSVALGWPSVNDTDPKTPDMIASLNSLASLAFYSNQSLVGGPTTGAICTGGACGGPPYQGVVGLYIFYTSPNQPSWLQIVQNGSPTGCPGIGPNGAFNNGHGYLGLDGSGVLGWAFPLTDAYTSWSSKLSMPQKTTLNNTTLLKCLLISSDPAPAGGTFASGAPSIGSPTYSATMVLLAN